MTNRRVHIFELNLTQGAEKRPCLVCAGRKLVRVRGQDRDCSRCEAKGYIVKKLNNNISQTDNELIG